MELWQESRLSLGGKRKIVEELEQVSRGKLFEVKDGARSYAVRMYDANPSFSASGIAPELLKVSNSFNVRHAHVLQLYDVELLPTSHLLLLYELAQGNLRDWLSLYRLQSTADEIVRLAFQLVQGLDSIHHHGFVHRRLTSNNVLVQQTRRSSAEIKIGDFHDLNVYYLYSGTTGVLPLDDQDVLYAAPEVLTGYLDHGSACDIWSLGIVLYEMIFGPGKYPFFTQGTDKRWTKTKLREYVIENIFRVLGSPDVRWRTKYTPSVDLNAAAQVGEGLQFPPQEGLDDLLDLVRSCLTLDPMHRPTTQVLLRHKAFVGREAAAFVMVEHPRVSLPRHATFRRLRSELVLSCKDDVQVEMMNLDAFLLAIDMFDRSANQVLQATACGDPQAVYNLFATCYLLALKLLTDDENPIKLAQGIVLIDDRNRATVLDLERQICNHLRFQFFPESIRHVRRKDKDWRKLQKRPLFG